MASALPKCSSFKNVIKLGYATQAAVQPKSTPTETGKFEVTKLPNGLHVLSSENHSPVAHIGIMLSAGSKYEKHNNLGVTHMLRLCSGFTNPSYTVFGNTRNLQQKGISLTTTASRDYILYQISGLRDHCPDVSRFLAALSTNQNYKHWEVSDNKSSLARDVAYMKQSPELELFEMLHEAAFHLSGLGNSLYSPDCMVGKHSSSMLNDFVANHSKAGSALMFGVGIDHKDLLSYAERLELPPGMVEPVDYPYFGGEIRKFTGGEYANVMVAIKGAGLKDLKKTVALSILKNILGNGILTPWGHCTGQLGKAGHKATSDNFAVSAFNASYKTSGLLGFSLRGTASSMAQLVPAVYQEFIKTISGTVPAEELARGKAATKLEMLSRLEQSSEVGELIGSQLLCNSDFSIENLLTAIDSTTAIDIKNVIGNNPSLSLACSGNTSKVPYLTELKP